MLLGSVMSAVPGPIDVGAVSDNFDPGKVTGSDLIFAGVSIVVGFILGNIVKRLVRRLLRGVDGIPTMAGDVIARIAQYVIITLGIVLALEALGFAFGLFGSLVILLVVFAFFATQPLLRDLGAGLTIQFRRPFEVGHQVVIGPSEGRVDEVSARAVEISAVDGRKILIPNSSVLQSPIINLTAEGARMTTFVAGVEYSTDLDRAREVIVAAMEDAPGVLAEPPPQAFVEEFDDSTINIACRFWHAPEIQAEWASRDEAMRSVKRALDANGITIAFPQRVLWSAPDDD